MSRRARPCPRMGRQPETQGTSLSFVGSPLLFSVVFSLLDIPGTVNLLKILNASNKAVMAK